MTMIPLKNIFTEHFKAALSSIGIVDYQSEAFVIIPISEQEKLTSRDEIYRLWITPTFSGIRMSFDSVIDVLVKEDRKVAPIQIKISKQENGPVILVTSQRYRKLRDIALRKRTNLMHPFEIQEEAEFEFDSQYERIEAIRVLFFKRVHSSVLKKLLGEDIAYNEAARFFENHFEKYRFYPPSFNQSNIGDESYSSLVINKDFDTNEFSLFTNPDHQKKKHSRLTLAEAIDIYIKEELKYEIYGIEITKKH